MITHSAILGIGEIDGALARDLLASGVNVSGWDPNPRKLFDGPAGSNKVLIWELWVSEQIMTS